MLAIGRAHGGVGAVSWIRGVDPCLHRPARRRRERLLRAALADTAAVGADRRGRRRHRAAVEDPSGPGWSSVSTAAARSSAPCRRSRRSPRCCLPAFADRTRTRRSPTWPEAVEIAATGAVRWRGGNRVAAALESLVALDKSARGDEQAILEAVRVALGRLAAALEFTCVLVAGDERPDRVLVLAARGAADTADGRAPMPDSPRRHRRCVVPGRRCRRPPDRAGGGHRPRRCALVRRAARPDAWPGGDRAGAARAAPRRDRVAGGARPGGPCRSGRPGGGDAVAGARPARLATGRSSRRPRPGDGQPAGRRQRAVHRLPTAGASGRHLDDRARVAHRRGRSSPAIATRWRSSRTRPGGCSRTRPATATPRRTRPRPCRAAARSRSSSPSTAAT